MNKPAFSRPPLLIGIGGTTRPGSSTERALAAALAHARTLGAQTQLFGGAELAALPPFNPEVTTRTPQETAFVEAVRQADGILLASPGYHGGVSGLVKNAIDLLEDLRGDSRVYLDGRAVGCIVTAAGWQGCNTTLGAMRGIVHALRGWPTPLGVTLNTAGVSLFDSEGRCTDDAVQRALATVTEQALAFAPPPPYGDKPMPALSLSLSVAENAAHRRDGDVVHPPYPPLHAGFSHPVRWPDGDHRRPGGRAGYCPAQPLRTGAWRQLGPPAGQPGWRRHRRGGAAHRNAGAAGA
ncbi:NADPH-dependent FMN reductase [Klebsiella quasipneumoniae]|uniref:NADPH-dependent FMN reductase n=1 Tax=Klebsiella quasipneumoniae TaxID=1463165 RepID=UPI003719376A